MPTSKAKARSSRENGKKGGRPPMLRTPLVNRFRFAGTFTRENIVDAAWLIKEEQLALVTTPMKSTWGLTVSKGSFVDGPHPVQNWKVTANG